MGSVMMKGRDDGIESKMGCGQREVRWWCREMTGVEMEIESSVTGDGDRWICAWVRGIRPGLGER